MAELDILEQARRAAVGLHLGARAGGARRGVSRARGQARRVGRVRRHQPGQRRAARRAGAPHEGRPGCSVASSCRTTPAGITSASRGGGQFRRFDTLFTQFVPALEAAGVDHAEMRQLLVDNPAARSVGVAEAGPAEAGPYANLRLAEALKTRAGSRLSALRPRERSHFIV